MHVTAGDADVLGTDAPAPGRRPSRALVAALCLVAVLAATVVALLQRQGPTPAGPVRVFRSMSLDSIDSRVVELPFAHRRERDGVATGTLRLELPSGHPEGEVRLESGASLESTDGQDVVTHAWGDGRLRLGAVACRSCGWRRVVEPLGGGARCPRGARTAPCSWPGSQRRRSRRRPGWSSTSRTAGGPPGRDRAQVRRRNAEDLCDALLVSSPL